MSKSPSIDQLIAYFKSHFSLKKEEKEELSGRFTERNIKRRGLILQEGDVCRHFTFVVTGLIVANVNICITQKETAVLSIELETGSIKGYLQILNSLHIRI